MTVRVVTAPVYEPVTLAEAKDWCRIDSDITDQDSTINLLISAMRRYAENRTLRAFIPRTLQMIRPCWDSPIVLPQPPLLELLSIIYVDTGGVEQTLASDQYVVHDWREPAIIVPEWNVSWPSIRGVHDAVRVNYIAGYAADGSPTEEATLQAGLPDNLKLWMQARISTLYENREHLIMSNQVQIPYDFADGLLDDLITAERIAG